MSDSLQRLCSFPSPFLLLPFPSFLTFLLLFSLFTSFLPVFTTFPFFTWPVPMALSCSNPSSLDRCLTQNSFFFTWHVLMALSPLLLHCENFSPRTHYVLLTFLIFWFFFGFFLVFFSYLFPLRIRLINEMK